jgi:hypothetical protein
MAQIASSKEFFKVVLPSGPEHTLSTISAGKGPVKRSTGVVP